MMNPVVRVMVQRAESRRHSLLELAGVVPDDYLDRVAPNETWTAREHLVHALAVDRPMAEFVGLVAQGAQPPDLGVALSQMVTSRSVVVQARNLDGLAMIFDASVAERQLVVEAMARLQPLHLDVVVPIPGARNAWGEPLGISVFTYLDQWANHDAVHEVAIREAIATRPDLSTVALTRRLR